MLEPADYFRFNESVDSSRYYKYKEKYESKIEEFNSKLDTTLKVMFVIDTLKELILQPVKNLIISEIDTANMFYYELLDKSISKRTFNIDSIYQPNVVFRYYSELPDTFKCNYGFIDNEFWIGSLGFSRILMDREKEIGIFYFGYQGSCTCGYGGYFLIRKINNRWRIIKKIITEVS